MRSRLLAVLMIVVSVIVTAALVERAVFAFTPGTMPTAAGESYKVESKGPNSHKSPSGDADSEIAFWRELHPATLPPARDLTAMVYDQARGRMVMFGGRTANYTFLNDTWEFNGTAWIQRLPANSPSARTSHTMAYDSVRQRVVLFGGFDGGWPADTWEWDGFTF